MAKNPFVTQKALTLEYLVFSNSQSGRSRSTRSCIGTIPVFLKHCGCHSYIHFIFQLLVIIVAINIRGTFASWHCRALTPTVWSLFIFSNCHGKVSSKCVYSECLKPKLSRHVNPQALCSLEVGRTINYYKQSAFGRVCII